MEITHIKQHLFLSQVLEHYGLKPKNNMLHCPFHEDKKASLQVNLEHSYYKCHACDKKGDVIQFVQDYEKLTKREALLKCTQMIPSNNSTAQITQEQNTKQNKNYQEIFQKLKPKLQQSSKAKDYLKQRNLNPEKLEIAYNTGKDYDKLKCCLIFPLKNKKNDIVSLYGRSIYDNPESKHFYTTNRTGIYPNYPKPETKKLILTESIIDCASLMQAFEVLPFGKDLGWAFIACYGTNGLNQEIQNAILALQELQEIIFCFDTDMAGKESVKKHAQFFANDYPNLKLTTLELPNKDINETLQLHEPEIFSTLLEQRILIFQSEEPENQPQNQPQENPKIYENQTLKIEVLGSIDLKDLASLRVTIVVTNKNKNNYPSRQNINLYNDDQTEKTIRKIAEKTELGTTILNKALHELIQQLEHYRSTTSQNKPQAKARHQTRNTTQNQETTALEHLKKNNIDQIIKEKLQQTGIIGEEKNALFLFLILLSHKMKRTLHAMVQGTSGSGKSHLIAKVADTMYNQNKIKRFTRVTDKSFYNYGEYDLQNTAIILEDYDGLSQEAEMAWRELQSNNKLSSSVSQKNEQTGEIFTGEKYVFGPIASLVATTKFRIYEDNESRVFTIAIDESEVQTERVLDYMSKKASKEITSEQEHEIQIELQNIVYMLQAHQVQNPYRLELPKNVKHRRRLTQMLHDFIEQVTILFQYQREKLNQETLIATVQDLEIAVDLMFNSIVIKADELDGILRQFYENLKEFVQKKGKNYEFTQREIRQEFRISKTQGQRYFNELEELEYINKSNLGKRNSYQYLISYWDNIEKIRQEIRTHLQTQIDQYKPKNKE
jgi:DNA primase